MPKAAKRLLSRSAMTAAPILVAGTPNERGHAAVMRARSLAAKLGRSLCVFRIIEDSDFANGGAERALDDMASSLDNVDGSELCPCEAEV
ncbi:MAG: hypothetical protein V2I43_23710, partial [Parvularcula sp.]|nr:hypothetical protein [Parvularcula sp.]